MKRRAFLACTSAAAMLTLSGCSTKSEAFRYRLTVEVETPQGLRSGYSVIEVKQSQTEKGFLIPPEARKLHFKVHGEAVAVEMADGKVLFVLLNRAEGLAYAALQPARLSGDFAYTEMTRNMKEIRRAADLPREAYPMLVTFGDLSDPASVAEVDPDNLAATFGEGVALKRMSVAMTRDSVTSGIENRLGWLPNVRGALVHVPISEYPPTGTPLPLHATTTETAFWRNGT